uniref:WWE domain-containing protein n=1 Tax=Caenorhabditis tropicalis TaxID=1561998 RepID=A0A1I7UQZ9_9PELO
MSIVEVTPANPDDWELTTTNVIEMVVSNRRSNKWKYCRERGKWLPNSSVAEPIEPIFMENENAGNMTVESLRHYSVYFQDDYGQSFEIHDPRQVFVTKSPAPSSKRKTDATEPIAKRRKEEEFNYQPTGGYYDWNIDCEGNGTGHLHTLKPIDHQ